MEKNCEFPAEDGKATLSHPFEGRSQFLVYHFDPSRDAGCKSRSFWADNYNGAVVHLKHREVPWLELSLEIDFNRDLLRLPCG